MTRSGIRSQNRAWVALLFVGKGKILNIVLGFKVNETQVKKIQSVLDRLEIAANLIVRPERDLASELQTANVFCGHIKCEVDWETIVNNGNLTWIQSSAAGLDHCLVREVIESEIQVSGASGLFANQVAETAMALLLGLLRRTYLFESAKRNQLFERLPTDDLSGKRVGIIGFGGNGQVIAKRLHAFPGVTVVASDLFADWNANGTFAECDDWLEVVSPERLLERLPEFDILIITVGLDESTRAMISREEFDRMKAGSYLINVGRGEVVDTSALIEALNENRLTAAGIDVVDPEPIPKGHPIWEVENLILTPHIGAQSATRFDDVTQLFCDNLRRFFSRERLINLVDKQMRAPRPGDRFDPLASVFS